MSKRTQAEWKSKQHQQAAERRARQKEGRSRSQQQSRDLDERIKKSLGPKPIERRVR